MATNIHFGQIVLPVSLLSAKLFSAAQRHVQKPLKSLLLCNYYAVTRPGTRVQCKRHSCSGSVGTECEGKQGQAPGLQVQWTGRALRWRRCSLWQEESLAWVLKRWNVSGTWREEETVSLWGLKLRGTVKTRCRYSGVVKEMETGVSRG